MALTITNDSKNSALSISNESKNGLTWANASFAWGDAEGNWEGYGVHIAREAKKSAITISNESKN